ncbi:hypothetical protein BCR34DRAFT_649621 [Clohesyomyces aquaticus]|uniref:Uncharacterized protein n=1 Tax=Clohesyomyces aquaticus TaxID=1231657 RepID=A0A1Y1ZSD6_9PLEO|nr:hypothetical protein BCR34DRAFT_649621 [Clohesyomyces aquaticus]
MTFETATSLLPRLTYLQRFVRVNISRTRKYNLHIDPRVPSNGKRNQSKLQIDFSQIARIHYDEVNERLFNRHVNTKRISVSQAGATGNRTITSDEASRDIEDGIGQRHIAFSEIVERISHSLPYSGSWGALKDNKWTAKGMHHKYAHQYGVDFLPQFFWYEWIFAYYEKVMPHLELLVPALETPIEDDSIWEMPGIEQLSIAPLLQAASGHIEEADQIQEEEDKPREVGQTKNSQMMPGKNLTSKYSNPKNTTTKASSAGLSNS